MPKDCLRFTTRVYRSHPLYDLLEGDQRGGQLLLDFATAWYAYRLGQQRDHAEAVHKNRKVEEPVRQTGDPAQPPIDGRLLDDALT